MAHLEEENEKKKEETRKRKAKDDQNINKNEIKMLKKDIEHLEKSASELMDKCEETRNIDYIIQANSFRRTVEIRKKKLKDCESKLG